MSARQIDEALELWKARLGAAAQNLLDLQSHPIFLRISARDANLAGETATQSALAVRTCSSLLQYCDLLQHAIARAEELRVDMPAVFGAEEREREILAVLQGRSIHLPSVQVPLGQRSLLSSVENAPAISPPELLTGMEAAFENVKQMVLRLTAAWEALGTSIEKASRELAELHDEAEFLSGSERRDLETAAQELQRLERAATEDPLGAGSQLLAGINETLRRVRAKVDEIKRQREQARAGLAGARSLLATLRSEHDAARIAYTEAREKTGFAFDFEVSDQKVEGLSAWFDRLSAASASAAPEALLVGLRNWTNAAQQTITADRAAMTQAKRMLDTRSELRGRLEALKAKARAHSLAEQDELVELADRASALLYKRPTPLEESAALVSAYEAKLNLHVKNIV